MTLPALSTPFVDDNGTIQNAWVDLLTEFANGGQGVPAKMTLQGSGVPIAAPGRGNFVVTAGTVSAITIIRGRPAVSVLMGITRGPVPVSKGDLMAVTYSALPTVTFLPS